MILKHITNHKLNLIKLIKLINLILNILNNQVRGAIGKLLLYEGSKVKKQDNFKKNFAQAQKLKWLAYI